MFEDFNYQSSSYPSTETLLLKNYLNNFAITFCQKSEKEILRKTVLLKSFKKYLSVVLLLDVEYFYVFA